MLKRRLGKKAIRQSGANVAVVGASGMVGKELIRILEARNFPVADFAAFSSGKKSKTIVFKRKKYICKRPVFDSLKRFDIVFFASTDEISRRFAKKLAESGVWCIDDSSAFRLDPKVPLVIPEINGHEIKPSKRLLAGPNCTLTGIAVAGVLIHKKYRINNLRISTYQAVSGAGRDALRQFDREMRNWLRSGRMPRGGGKILPHPIAFNLFPQVGGFDEHGRSVEENKIRDELRKIWNAPDLKISSTAVRAPVLRGHSLSVWIETEKKWKLADIKKLLSRTRGLKFYENPYEYPVPLGIERAPEVKAGRLRKSETGANEMQLWIVSDNLCKGAALNSVQIAEQIIKNKRIENSE
ncbi:MAG: aspartate-semialdehyde dehydrogenase [Elusimicrobia bacterium]|nr:aspartate-semialdehyde dehydrogenase [Elusimicrobiota bacterium]